MTTTRTKRGVAAAFATALIAVAALTLAACSGSSSPSTTIGEPTAPAPDSQFPVTIENKFGTTEIPGQPERIVTVGFHEQDWLYAMGLAPIAVREWYGGYDYATWPWADDARKAVGAEPTVLGSGDLDMEADRGAEP